MNPRQPRDPRQPQHPRPDRPSTLGQAWQSMRRPPQKGPRDLPVLPDWPPLPEEPSQADWRSLPDEPSQAEWPSLDVWAPDETGPSDALQTTQSDERWRPDQQTVAAQPGWRDALRRLRGASKRARLGIAIGTASVLVVLIVACSSLAMRTANRLVTGAAQGNAAASTRLTSAQSATPNSTVTATPAATSQPTMTTTPTPPLTLVFTCASGSLRGTGQVCVHTQPQAALSITVRYCDGSTAKGLHGSVTADASGNYTWSWPLRTSSCAGSATATVTATWNGQSLTQSDTFTITQ